MENKICSKCGAEMPNDAKFCTKCGQSFEKITPKNQANKQKLNKKSLYALLAVFAALFLIIFGAMFYSDYSERREARLAREKFVKDSLEVVRKDSLKLVAQKEKEMLEAKKLEEFRGKFTLNNIFQLLKHPDNASLAQKCGLSLLYKDSEQVEGYEEGEKFTYRNIVYGYEVEKGEKHKGGMGYNVKDTSNHSCYFEYVDGGDTSSTFLFVNKSDCDYLFEMLKDYGLIDFGGENTYYIPKSKISKGITYNKDYYGDILYHLSYSRMTSGWYAITFIAYA